LGENVVGDSSHENIFENVSAPKKMLFPMFLAARNSKDDGFEITKCRDAIIGHRNALEFP